MITAGSTAQQHLPGAERHADRPLKSLFRATDRGAAPAERAIAFGHFRLLPARRLLLVGDEPVRLGSRALEILIALVERPGELVSKDELMARVWPSTFVEDRNLKVQVAGLRRGLGDRRGSNRYLATVPGRGYRFVAPRTQALSDRRWPPARRAIAADRQREDRRGRSRAIGSARGSTLGGGRSGEGRFDQYAMLALVEEVLGEGKDRFGLTRLWANMEWSLEDFPGVDDIVQYECRLNQVTARVKDVVVCTYDLNRFSATWSWTSCARTRR